MPSLAMMARAGLVGDPGRLIKIRAAGDWRGRMVERGGVRGGPYLISRQRLVMSQMGDPFLGGFFRAIGRGLGWLGRTALASSGIMSPGSRAPDYGPPKALPAPEPRITRTTARVGHAGEHRRRRMNALNPRALRRSMSRVQSFARFAKKTISFTARIKMRRRRRR